MKRLSVLIILFFLLTSITVFAQKKAQITFVNTEFDFGAIKEDGGTRSCTYEFSNTGNDSLKILKVITLCGCISCDWTKTAIAPNGKGYVQTTFNPMNRVGILSRGVEVITNDPDQPSITLVLRGSVEARTQTIADIYPSQIGNLRFGSSQITFQNLPSTAVLTDSMKLYNEWNQTMTFGFTKLPAYVNCKVVPEELKPSQKGVLLVTYDASIRNDFGMIYDRFSFETNDSLQSEKIVSIAANIVEDFSKMTPEELANAAKIKFETYTSDFDTVNEGDKVEVEFVFTNIGKNDLYIRKVKGS